MSRNLPRGIYVTPDGRYRALVRLDKKLVHCGVHDTVDQALRERESVKAAHARLAAGRKRDTFAAWAEKWLDDRETSGKHRSAANDRARFNKHVLTAPWAGMPLRAVRKQHIREWLRSLERTPATITAKGGKRVAAKRLLSAQTVLHTLNLVRRCFADAIEVGKLNGDNPASGLKPRETPAPEKAIHLSVAELNRLLALEDLSDRIRAIYTVAAYTGLRPGELWALRWEDVRESDDAPELTVRYSHRGPTKSGKIRVVPLLPPAQRTLTAWRRRDGVTRVSGLVFCCGDKGIGRGWVGWHQCAKGYDASWSTWARKAGINTDRVKFRHLRSTFATHLASGSWGVVVPLQVVQAWLGHESLATTEEHYAQVTPAALHGVRAALASGLK